MELSATWQPTPQCWLQYSGSHIFNHQLTSREKSANTFSRTDANDALPKNQHAVRLFWAPSERWDTALNNAWHSEQPAINLDDEWTIDGTIRWHITDRIALSLIGKNLTGARVETVSDQIMFDRYEVPRQALLQFTGTLR